MGFIFRKFEPIAELRGIVRQTFHAHGQIPYRTDKILPTGVVSLLFTICHPHRTGKSPNPDKNEIFDHSRVSGLQTTPMFHTPTNETNVLGVLFEPAGCHAPFNCDMLEIVERTTDPRTILPEPFISLVESMYAVAGDSKSHIAICECLALLKQNDIPEWVEEFNAAIVNDQGNVNIDSWYSKSGRSTRYATDLFRKSVGVTPKVLCRIHRLTALLEAIDPQAAVNWASLAHEYDFYDQAHFNHEFRKLCGLYPSEYVEQRKRDLPELAKGESVAFAPQR